MCSCCFSRLLAVLRLHIYAGVAHLVERHLAKVEVAGSSPVARSTNENRSKSLCSCSLYGDIAKW